MSSTVDEKVGHAAVVLSDDPLPAQFHRAAVAPTPQPGRRTMPRKKVSTTIYIEPEQLELLKTLNERTKVPMAEYIREGIDLVLHKHADKLPGQLPLDAVGSTARRTP